MRSAVITGDHQREDEHGPVDRRLGQPRKARRCIGPQHSHRDAGERDAQRSAEDRQHGAFCNEQSRKSRRAGAERHADGQLTTSRLAAHEQEAGDVRAGDEQHEHHRAEHDEQHWPHASGDLFLDRNDERMEADIRHVAELLQLGDERSELRVRRGGGCAGSEARDGVNSRGSRHPSETRGQATRPALAASVASGK